MKSLYFTFEAKKDLDEIHDYIARDSPQKALSFLDFLQGQCKKLVMSPKIGRVREELGFKIRSFPIKNYIIFYRADKLRIEIIRIIHSARDVENIFNE